MKSGRIIAHKNTQVFSRVNKKTKVSRRMFYEWMTAEFTGTWRLLEVTAPQNSAVVTDVALRSMLWTRYQSTFLVFHLKRGRFNFWDLLHCDNQKSPWWASRDGPLHDCSRSDAIVICINFKNNASLVMFFQPFLFYSVLFLNKNCTYYASVNCVWVLLPLFGFVAACSWLACSKISPLI